MNTDGKDKSVHAQASGPLPNFRWDLLFNGRTEVGRFGRYAHVVVDVWTELGDNNFPISCTYHCQIDGKNVDSMVVKFDLSKLDSHTTPESSDASASDLDLRDDVWE